MKTFVKILVAAILMGGLGACATTTLIPKIEMPATPDILLEKSKDLKAIQKPVAEQPPVS